MELAFLCTVFQQNKWDLIALDFKCNLGMFMQQLETDFELESLLRSYSLKLIFDI